MKVWELANELGHNENEIGTVAKHLAALHGDESTVISRGTQGTTHWDLTAEAVTEIRRIATEEPEAVPVWPLTEEPINYSNP